MCDWECSIDNILFMLYPRHRTYSNAQCSYILLTRNAKMSYTGRPLGPVRSDLHSARHPSLPLEDEHVLVVGLLVVEHLSLRAAHL